MAVSRETLRRLRDLATTVGTEVDDTVRSLTAAWLRAWDELDPAWRRALNDVITVAATTGRWPPPWQLFQITSVATAASRSEAALALLAADAGVTAGGAVSTVVAATAAAEPAIVASQAPAHAAVDLARRVGAAVAPSALDLIVRRTRQQITAATRPLAPAAAEAMRRALIRGVAVGANPDDAARDMVRRVEGAFAGGLERATVIARTELLDVMRATSTLVHQANPDVVDGWVWLATLTDARGCAACWAMHGTVHPLSEPGPNGHPQCRCARMPRLKPWPALGFGAVEPPDLVPDARTIFNSLPDLDQVKILGRGRLALLRAGRITWDQIPMRRRNPGWRDAIVPRPLRDLQRLATPAA